MQTPESNNVKTVQTIEHSVACMMIANNRRMNKVFENGEYLGCRTLEEKIKNARENSMILAHKAYDRDWTNLHKEMMCFAAVLYTQDLDFFPTELEVGAIMYGDGSYPDCWTGKGVIKFTKKTAFGLPMHVKEVVKYMYDSVRKLQYMDNWSTNISAKMKPSYLALVDKTRIMHCRDVTYYTELQIYTSFEIIYNKLVMGPNILLSGDVEENPGPFGDMQVQELIHKHEEDLIKQVPMSMRRKFCKVMTFYVRYTDKEKESNGKLHFWSAQRIIHHRLTRMPRLDAFVQYKHSYTLPAHPIKVSKHGGVLVTSQDFYGLKVKPVTVKATPLSTALQLLNTAASGVWCVPIIRNKGTTISKALTDVYTRVDGKEILIYFQCAIRDKSLYEIDYISIAQVPYFFKEYISYCVTQYFRELAITNKIASTYFGIYDQLKVMYRSNPIIKDILNHLTCKNFSVFIFADYFDMGVFGMTSRSLPMYKKFLQAPVKSEDYRKWYSADVIYAMYGDYPIIPDFCLTEYGVGAPIAFGYLKQGSITEHAETYFSKKPLHELKLPCTISHFNSLALAFLDLYFNMADLGRRLVPNLNEYGKVHLTRSIYVYGLYDGPFDKFIDFPTYDLCPSCYDAIKVCKVDAHCMNAKNASFAAFMKHLCKVEGIFNYWVQKMLKLELPSWNALQYWDLLNSYIEHPFVRALFIDNARLMPLQPTMDTTEVPLLMRVTGMTEPYVATQRIASSLQDQLLQTQQMLDQVRESDLIGRAEAALTNIENSLPMLKGDAGLTDYFEVLDSFLTKQVYKTLQTVFPFFDESKLPKVRFSKIFRDYLLYKHVENKVLRVGIVIDMLHQAGLFETLERFYKGSMHFAEATGKGCMSWSNMTEWIISLLEKPLEWVQNPFPIISGFVSMMCDKFCAKSLFKYIANVAPNFRNITMIGNGLNSIGMILNTIMKYYYLAKEYVCGKMGVKCTIPLMYATREHATNWCAAVDVVCMPVHRNTIIATPDSWEAIHDLAKIGLEISRYAAPAVLSMLTARNKSLLKLRSDISWCNGINPSTFVPFVVHLNGPPNIGKSGLVNYMIEVIGTAMGLHKAPYMYNEVVKWFDGYNQEEILVCDDVNLSKTPDTAVWLIKLVSPNLCYLSTAENETRPMISNVKLVILTSNTPYSPVEGIATTKGIDRRSTFKFDVRSDDYDMGTTGFNNKKVDWSTTHKFTRIPSVKDDHLSKEDQFTGNRKELLTYLCEEALKHKALESERVKSNSQHRIKIDTTAELRESILEGLVPGNEKLCWDTVRDKIKAIKFVTRESFIGLSNATVDAGGNLEPKDHAYIADIVATYNRFEYSQLQQAITRVANAGRPRQCWPVYKGNAIFYDTLEPEEPAPPLETKPLLDKTYEFQGLMFDPFFLHHLEFIDHKFRTTSTYMRTAFVDPMVLPEEATFDYHTLESLIIDSSFMKSHNMFFSLNRDDQLVLYFRFKQSVVTNTRLYYARKSVWTKITNLFKNVSLGQCLSYGILTLSFSFMSLATVGMFYEMMSSMLVYNDMRDAIKPTSNAPKPAQQKSGIHRATGTAGISTDVGFANIKSKVRKNIYLAQWRDHRGESTGVFNISFLCERFAIIPKHAAQGLPVSWISGGVKWYDIWIYSEFHNTFLKYSFNSENAVGLVGKDVTVIYLPHFRSQRSIIHAWHDDLLDDQYFDSVFENLYWDRVAFNCREHRYKTYVSQFAVGVAKNSFTFVEGYQLDGKSFSGSSGGLHLVDNPRLQSKIVGMQSATALGLTYVQAIRRSELLHAIDVIRGKMEVKVCLPTCDVIIQEQDDIERPTKIGITTPEDAIRIPPKTSMKRTPWFDVVYPPPTSVPVMKYAHPDELYNFVNKTELTELKPFDIRHLNSAVVDYANYLSDSIKQVYKNVRPISYIGLTDAVCGNYIGGKPLDLTSSPGIGVGNWVKNRKQSGQHDLIWWDGSDYFITDTLKQAVRKLCSDCSSGVVTTSTYAAFPKDELRPKGKDARGIDGSPIEQKIVYRMLFGRLDGILASINTGQLKYGLGINLFSPAGTNLISRMTDYCFAWDFSKFDGSITWQLYEAVCQVYNILSQNDEFCTARKTLAYITCHATIVAQQDVYQPNKGMRSGFGGTSSFNTHIHNLLIIMAVKNLLKSKINPYPDIRDVFEAVDWITYGDDGLAWLKDPSFQEVVNGTTIAMEFERMGMVVADPRGKSSLPEEFVSIKEATFLKQSPYFDEYLGFPVFRCQPPCLQSVFNYYHGDDPYEPLDSAFNMLWPYGPDIYETIRTKLNLVSNKLGVRYEHNWEHFYEVFLEQFATAVYTGNSKELVRATRVRDPNTPSWAF